MRAMSVVANTDEGLELAGTYRLGPLIGYGAMGTVYEATHVRLRKRVAVKFLDRAYGRDSEAYTRFQREAEIASSLGNPHIAQVVDFNTLADGAPYLVMELLEGETLASRLDAGALSTEEVQRLSAQLASALTETHLRGVVHRDLKPDNIFLCTGDGAGFTVKVLDFGISKIRGAKTLTRDASLLGTPGYMSPEQAQGDIKRIDHRTDVYAMGAVLYEALSGTPAYPGDNIYEILTRLATCSAPHLEGHPAAVDAVLQRALARDPLERFDSVAELHLALVAALHEPDEPARAPTDAEPAPRAEIVAPTRRRGRAFVYGLATIAALGATLVIEVIGSPAPAPAAPRPAIEAAAVNASAPPPAPPPPPLEAAPVRPAAEPARVVEAAPAVGARVERRRVRRSVPSSPQDGLMEGGEL